MVKEGDLITEYKNYRMPPPGDFPEIGYEEEIQLKRSFMFPLALGLPFDHILVTSIQIYDNDDIRDYLTRKRRELNITVGFGHAESLDLQNMIDQYIKEIETYGYTSCSVGVSVIINDSSFSELEKKSKYVLNNAAQMNGTGMFTENADTLSLFFANAPGLSDANYRTFLSLTSPACCYFNKETNYFSDTEGLLYVDRMGGMVVVEAWKSMVAKNGIVIAPTGTGKSVFLCGFISRNFSLPYPVDVTVIDIGYSYQRLVEFERGLHYDGRNKDMFKFSLFLCDRDKSGKYLYRDEDSEEANDRVNYIRTVLSVIWKGGEPTNRSEENILDDMIISFYDHFNENPKDTPPILTFFFDYIEYYKDKVIKEKRKKYFDFEAFIMSLEPFVHNGEYAYLLNSTTTTINQDYNFTVYDLEEIKAHPKIFPIVCLVIIEQTLTKIKNKQGRKYLIMDEAFDFLEDPKMADFIASMYRTVRKKNGSIILATQNIDFFNNLDPKTSASIISNSHFKCLLSHKQFKSSYKVMQNLGICSDYDIELLDSLIDGTEQGKPYREFLLILNQKRFVLRNELSPFEYAVYNTDKEEVMKIKELFEKYKNQYKACKEYVKLKSKES